MKTISIVCAVIFLFSGSACSQEKEGSVPKGLKERVSSNPAVTSHDKEVSPSFLVYYFHGDARCPSCMKLETYAEEAVQENFQNEIESGQMVFRTVNVDEKSNRHFIGDYQLYSKAVVLVDNQEGASGRWKNLDKIWVLLSRKEKFKKYIAEELKTFMKD